MLTDDIFITKEEENIITSNNLDNKKIKMISDKKLLNKNQE